jgi:phosphopantetheinyl transferase
VSEPLAIEVVIVDIVDVEPRRASTVLDTAARVVIGSRLAVYPTLVFIEREPSGRPIAEGVALSLAHSGGLGAIAISDPGARVGIDVERVRPRRYLDRIATRIFDADELVALAALDDAARLLAFLRRWTEVEAILKAQGTGIAGGFANAVPRPHGWSCEPIDCGPGFVGTVAADAPSMKVQTRQLGN